MEWRAEMFTTERPRLQGKKEIGDFRVFVMRSEFI
jgi:hypothetical protein